MQQMSPFFAVRGGDAACSQITLSGLVIVVMISVLITYQDFSVAALTTMMSCTE